MLQATSFLLRFNITMDRQNTNVSKEKHKCFQGKIKLIQQADLENKAYLSAFKFKYAIFLNMH